jgi:hypothetical protein
VVVCAFTPLLAKSVHIIPAKLADDMFESAGLAEDAEAHVKVGATFVNVTVGAVFAFLTLLLHEFGTDLQVVTEVALVTVTALSGTLELIARFYFAFVVRVRAIIRKTAFAVDEFFADTIGGELVVVRDTDRLLCGRTFIKRIEIPWVGRLIIVVH